MSGYHETDPTRRFSSRVENYVKYRPHYPAAVLEWIVQRTGLEPGWTVADVGSGTGILARLFLNHGNAVVGVEPNADMRAAGDIYLGDFARFNTVDGLAEHTGLPDGSVDLVVVGQAFHWFNPEDTAREFRRILVPGGQTVLVWNTRLADATPFMRAYENLLVSRAVDYTMVDHRNVDAGVLGRFFGAYTRNTLTMKQLLDYAAFEGRLMSSSYAPAPGHDKHAAMIEGMRQLFDQYQTDGVVEMCYETEMYCGPPAAPEHS
jgi:ubiquinone/menaquinone biosynthesis C-methylase UbiE